MPVPFQAAADRFGLPTTGATPEQFFPPEDDAIARYRQYLNTGSDVLPTAQPPGPDLDEADWSAISRSADPMTTLKLVDQLKAQKDYSHGVREIGDLDWSNPAKAAQDLAGIYARRPNAGHQLQQFGSGVYKMLGVQKPNANAAANKDLPDDVTEYLAQLHQLDPTSEDWFKDSREIGKKFPKALRSNAAIQALGRLDTHALQSSRSDATLEARNAAADKKASILKVPSSKQSDIINNAILDYENAMKPDRVKEADIIAANGGVKPTTDADWWKIRNQVMLASPKLRDARNKLQSIRDMMGEGYRMDRRVPKYLGEPTDEGHEQPALAPAPPTTSGGQNKWKITPIR